MQDIHVPFVATRAGIVAAGPGAGARARSGVRAGPGEKKRTTDMV